MKFKIILTLSLLIFIKVSSLAQNEGKGIVFFEGSWSEALLASKKQNKPIFLDAYASWCGPCKRMSKKVFTKEASGMFYNEHFINVKMDMEKGEGRSLSSRLGLTAYPTLFFIDYKGNVIAKSVGYHTVSAFLDVGGQVVLLLKEK